MFGPDKATTEHRHRLVSAVLALKSAVLEVAQTLERQRSDEPVAGPLLDRLDELERNRALWEATMEAELLKADSTYKSARNAEERARKKRGQHEDSEGDIAGPDEVAAAYAAAGFLPQGNEEGSDSSGVLALRDGMEVVDPTTAAVRAKYGI